MKKTGVGAKDNVRELTIELFGPGMTALHKAGLAGLWMTLETLEKENGGKAEIEGGTWHRTNTSVTLRWNASHGIFFSALLKASFRLDKNGLVWLPALGEPLQNPQHAVILQEAILGTFLQHGQTRKSDKRSDPKGNVSVEIDGKVTPIRFHKISSYSHQNCDYVPFGTTTLAGWLSPGGVVRHVGLGQSSALEDPAERALALRYAPSGAIFFEIRQRKGGVRPVYAIVLPDIRDLESYAVARRAFVKYGVQQFYAAGTSEAGYRVLSELHAAGLLPDIRSSFCQVISFGIVPWSTQQKTRVNLMVVRAGSEEALRTFNLCRMHLTPKYISTNKGAFWDVPQVPDLVAKNLSEGRNWWDGFADFIVYTDRQKHVFRYEKGGLAAMVQDSAAFPKGPEYVFVQACHEAWHRRMGKIGEKARRESSSFTDQINREFVRLHMAFARCKNASSLREAVTDFWARGGSLPALQDSWHEVLALMDDKNWKKARDLVLLALASYKPKTKQEQEVLDSIESIDDKGGE